MKHIMDQRKIPKVQVERAIGPILGFFIEELLSVPLNDELVMICAEFPLRKLTAGSNQSTNIDWLLYGKTNRQLVFVELKTTGAFNGAQFERYCDAVRSVKGSAEHLLADVREIRRHSDQQAKYDELLKPIRTRPFSDCTKATLVYIMPEMPASEITVDGVELKWLRLCNLKVREGFRFAREWKVIQECLEEFREQKQIAR